VAAFTESKDKYPEVTSRLAPHVAQLLRLSYSGVVVGGHRRALRLFVMAIWGTARPCCAPVTLA